MLSNKRVSDLHTLNDFVKNSHDELTWLNEKEDKELGRDWADRNLSAQEVRCTVDIRLLTLVCVLYRVTLVVEKRGWVLCVALYCTGRPATLIPIFCCN